LSVVRSSQPPFVLQIFIDFDRGIVKRQGLLEIRQEVCRCSSVNQHFPDRDNLFQLTTVKQSAYFIVLRVPEL
jgi:hypothetical protein